MNASSMYGISIDRFAIGLRVEQSVEIKAPAIAPAAELRHTEHEARGNARVEDPQRQYGERGLR